jgi:hypothetical protein
MNLLGKFIDESYFKVYRVLFDFLILKSLRQNKPFVVPNDELSSWTPPYDISEVVKTERKN